MGPDNSKSTVRLGLRQSDSQQRLGALWDDPGIVPFRYDPVLDRVLLIRLDRDQMRKASFLDERCLQPDNRGAWIGAEALGTPPRSVGARCWIFHIGHCGSTLLARILGESRHSISLREPLALRTLSDLARDLGAPSSRLTVDQFVQRFHLLTALLGRTGPGVRQVVIKATSNSSGLLPFVLQHCAGDRIVLLHAPFNQFAASLLKGGIRNVSTHGYLVDKYRDYMRLGHRPPCPLAQMTTAEILALNWVAVMEVFRRVERVRPDRVLRVDFEQLMSSRRETLGRIVEHFDWPGSIEELVASPLWGRHAKAEGYRYSLDDRRHDLELARTRHASLIQEASDLLPRHLTDSL